MKRFLPFFIFAALMIFFAVGLGLNPREIPSPLIGKPTPAFALPDLHEPQRQITAQDMKGQVWMLNVWASWCAACHEEHPLLMQLAKSDALPMVGLHYKDKRDEGINWLQKYGNPYLHTLHDPQGRSGIDYGVVAVPETFVIDQAGVIRFKHTGPLTQKIIENRLLPLIRELERA